MKNFNPENSGTNGSDEPDLQDFLIPTVEITNGEVKSGAEEYKAPEALNVDNYTLDENLANTLSESIQDKLSNLLLQNPESKDIKQILLLQGSDRIKYLFESKDPALVELASWMKTEIDNYRSLVPKVEITKDQLELAQNKANSEPIGQPQSAEVEEVSSEKEDIEKNQRLISEFNSELASLDNNSFKFENGTFSPNPDWELENDKELEKQLGLIRSTLSIYGYEINGESDLSTILDKIRIDREKLTKGVFGKFLNRNKIENLDRLLSKKDDMFYGYYGLKNKKDRYLEKYQILATKYQQLPQPIQEQITAIDNPNTESIMKVTNQALEKLQDRQL